MNSSEKYLLALNLERRIKEMIAEHGSTLFPYEIDRQEWTAPEYSHQN